MGKYSFKVYLNDNGTKILLPSDIKNTNLPDIDKYVFEQGGYFCLCQKLADELNISSSKIQKVTILRNSKEVEFSVIGSNQYLEPVLSDLSIKKIPAYKNYTTNATIISDTNKTFLEMKKYLFEQIRTNPTYFLNNIYNYKNEFSKLLHQYGTIYPQEHKTEEDMINLGELERKISLELTVYKNYRGLCIARNKNNRTYYKPKNVKNLKVTNEVYYKTNDYYLDKYGSNYLNKQVETYNQEHEEFLEPDEYEMMTGETDKTI